MKYYKFNLDWSNPNEGLDPTGLINKDKIIFIPNFAIGDEPNRDYYAYLIEGSLDTNLYSNFNLVEVTKDTFFNEAIKIYENAYWQNDIILWPMSNILFNGNT